MSDAALETRPDLARTDVDTVLEFFACDSSSFIHQWRFGGKPCAAAALKLHFVKESRVLLTSADTNGSVCLHGPVELKVLFSFALANALELVRPLSDHAS